MIKDESSLDRIISSVVDPFNVTAVYGELPVTKYKNSRIIYRSNGAVQVEKNRVGYL
jgi:hypothetical protein